MPVGNVPKNDVRSARKAGLAWNESTELLLEVRCNFLMILHQHRFSIEKWKLWTPVFATFIRKDVRSRALDSTRYTDAQPSRLKGERAAKDGLRVVDITSWIQMCCSNI